MSSGSSSIPRMIKKKHFRVKHQKVKLFRANEPILSVFMWGINHTINELSHVNIPVMLLPDDFRAYSKIKVDNHLFNKENMPSHFKVKEYCPLVFRNLRERFGVDDVDYRESLTRSQPVQIDSSGKSGAQFYRSYDKYFILKSLTSEEIERMHAFLKHYHPYVVERHGSTLLPQYLGMYRLTVDGVQYYFVVMRNVFSSHLTIHRKFDLKGSTVDREASDKELEKHLPTLKDNDFIKQKIRICIGEDAKQKLFEILNADINFLTKLHLMDYSLLVGIHDMAQAEEEALLNENANREAAAGRETSESEECESGERCAYNTPPDSPRCLGQYNDIIQDIDIYALHSIEERREIYFIAIIDVLTQYGVKKQAAKAAKTVKYGSNVDGISTCDPDQYGKRFIEFIDKAIE
ncbi:phosphatidylinositol 5-phosphate 4-kinase type-2 beta [Sitodiplosis mosellana]|uniref:phosphatidylinositol 5-phosphate 4-kinase type-2 beta n=1 Tax=Sitodiplosis mosellana TaxID=263140 RepID=UPI002444071A|nr:phosphatidylinositol 5-phosphate 4-kinase type-2 beta [Sitodiplosis mosellana]XP_055308330.1 phosphatidylinositol 5-phosphate 4-kinase type-2 beta [Sitodiplosis mosellana]XP_055308331.1 phosphatidylinositol 5-phosphate 4-kinase type-2 beta [Sitodiplosis mosellana]XP_055308332.1 phosphatidylinositol 5-phosphate 4-kinase type-2 beta [Sitodiplosis mosellana]XP_055308333.1 phosphatidylinositol 5-phosphate 4-kinase type-2 beta [Sitodiplosis mosellana]